MHSSVSLSAKEWDNWVNFIHKEGQESSSISVPKRRKEPLYAIQFSSPPTDIKSELLFSRCCPT